MRNLGLEIFHHAGLLQRGIMNPRIRPRARCTRHARPRTNCQRGRRRRIRPALIKGNGPRGLEPRPIHHRRQMNLFDLNQLRNTRNINVLTILRRNVLRHHAISNTRRHAPRRAHRARRIRKIRHPIIRTLRRRRRTRGYHRARTEHGGPTTLSRQMRRGRTSGRHGQYQRNGNIMKPRARRAHCLGLARRRAGRSGHAIRHRGTPRTTRLTPTRGITLNLKAPRRRRKIARTINENKGHGNRGINPFRMQQHRTINMPKNSRNNTN